MVMKEESLYTTIGEDKLRRLQLIEFEIYKALISICQKHNLRCYLSCGTLLGAVRHNGFIPWDDDLDVCMPRKDFEAFLEIAPGELPQNMTLTNYNNPDTKIWLDICQLKILHNEKFVVRTGEKKRVEPVWIDIFVLDGLPNSIIERKWHLLMFKYINIKYRLSIWDAISFPLYAEKPSLKHLIKYFIIKTKIIGLFKLDIVKIRKDQDNLLRKYAFDTSNIVCCLLGAYPSKEICPKECYGEGKLYLFEGAEVLGPADADYILKKIYGNYMELPKKEDQVCSHIIDYLENL